MDDVVEEAADHQASSLVFRDPAATQVEQLFVVESSGGAGVPGADDLLDALACAAIARRLRMGIAEPFPNPPPVDRYGLPMAIWALARAWFRSSTMSGAGCCPVAFMAWTAVFRAWDQR